ncbi:MAG: nucleotide exchange factor GrpE [Lachnospiraceae bacterium]|nr:nucleotide exchange factor GrpE [Lachnospiraceae bacterium]
MEKKKEDDSRKVTIDKLKELEKELQEAAEQQAEETAETAETEEAGEEAAGEVSEETSEETSEEATDEAEAAGEETEEVSEEAADGEDEKEAKPKKKLFGGKEKKKDKLQEQIDELKDKNMRQMAEFENFRKRTEKEKQAMFETGARSVIEKLLPVVDNFERGLGALKEEEKGAFSEGMEMIYKQLMSELEKLEVKPIDAVGKEFDPNLHNAVMHVDDEELGENIVAEELQKGYMYRETVVRHSMVKVAN